MNKNKGIIKEYFPEWTLKKAKKMSKNQNLIVALFILEIFKDNRKP